MEVPCTLTFVGQSQDIKKVQKLIVLVPVKSITTPPSKRVKVEVPWPVIVEDEQTSSEIEGSTDPQWLKFQGCLLTESDRGHCFKRVTE